MCRRTRCWRSGRDRVAIEELPRRRRAARRRSSSCRGCQAFVGEPLPPWPQLRLIVVPRERAGLNRGVPASRAEHMARRSDQRGQGPRPGPVPRAPRGLLHPGALNGRGRERVLSGGKKYRRRLLILCAGLLPGAQIAERVGRALALLARTKVRSPARPRARHPAPCPAPRSPCPRAPLSALARRSRYSPCPPAPLAGARRPGRAEACAGGCARARARESSRPAGASVRRLRVVLCEFTNTTHKHTQTHRPAAENALELTIDLRGGGVAVEEWMRGGRHGGKGENTGSERGGESARCRGCQGDAPRGPGARWRRRGGRLFAVRPSSQDQEDCHLNRTPFKIKSSP